MNSCNASDIPAGGLQSRRMPSIHQAVEEFVSQNPDSSELLKTLTFYLDEWGKSLLIRAHKIPPQIGPDVLREAHEEGGAGRFCDAVSSEQLPHLVPDFVEWFLARKVFPPWLV